MDKIYTTDLGRKYLVLVYSSTFLYSYSYNLCVMYSYSMYSYFNSTLRVHMSTFSLYIYMSTFSIYIYMLLKIIFICSYQNETFLKCWNVQLLFLYFVLCVWLPPPKLVSCGLYCKQGQTNFSNCHTSHLLQFGQIFSILPLQMLYMFGGCNVYSMVD